MQQPGTNPASNPKRPFTKKLPLEKSDYFEILNKTEALRLHSGLVTLAPGKEVGWHSTENYEELLIILNGCGKLQAKGFPDMEVSSGQIAYNPPQTEHNVINSGSELMRYIYIVTPVL